MKKPPPWFFVFCADGLVHTEASSARCARESARELDASAYCGPHRVVRYEATEPKPRKRVKR